MSVCVSIFDWRYLEDQSVPGSTDTEAGIRRVGDGTHVSVPWGGHRHPHLVLGAMLLLPVDCHASGHLYIKTALGILFWNYEYYLKHVQVKSSKSHLYGQQFENFHFHIIPDHENSTPISCNTQNQCK